MELRFPVTISQDEDGWYVAEVPDLPGCLSQGETEEEAWENIRDAFIGCLTVRAEDGLYPFDTLPAKADFDVQVDVSAAIIAYATSEGHPTRV